MYKIEKGIQEPRSGHREEFPFEKMEPGDSFFIPKEGPHSNTVQWAIQRFKALNPGSAFKTRKENDGRRVWRMA